MSRSRAENLAGQVFGRLTVVRQCKSNSSHARWECACACGGQTVTQANHLKSGHAKSCGCLKREVPAKHGKSNTPTYKSWEGMRYRTSNPNSKYWHCYGGRGIKCCERWGNFENFLLDMGEMPKDYSLERIDNDGNYEPENCKWIPKNDQSRNRRHPSLWKPRKKRGAVGSPV